MYPKADRNSRGCAGAGASLVQQDVKKAATGKWQQQRGAAAEECGPPPAATAAAACGACCFAAECCPRRPQLSLSHCCCQLCLLSAMQWAAIPPASAATSCTGVRGRIISQHAHFPPSFWHRAEWGIRAGGTQQQQRWYRSGTMHSSARFPIFVANLYEDQARTVCAQSQGMCRNF